MSKLYIAMYHYVRDLVNSRYPGIRGLDYKLFKGQIEYFHKSFHVVTMEEVIASYNESYTLPDKSLLLTFDDGYKDHFDFVYPVLKDYKMQGSFFIPGKTFAEHTVLDVNKLHFLLATTNIDILIGDLYSQMDYYRGSEYDYPSNEDLFSQYAVETRFDSKETMFFKRVLQFGLPDSLRHKITNNIFEQRLGINENMFSRELYINYDQIKCMRAGGMFIGCHGYDHYWMNKLTKEELEIDINKGLECLDGLYDNNSWVMNYPYGSYSDEAISCVSSMGCKLGLSTDVDICDKNSNKFKLPRLDTNDFPPKSDHFMQF